MASHPISSEEFESVEEILNILPNDKKQQIKNILYGKGIDHLQVSNETYNLAKTYNFDLQTCKFSCKPEELRPSRMVRVGLFQHKLPLATNVPITEQRNALFKMALEAIETASIGGVNIFCFQEAWNMPFAFCTREKLPWCEYAESVLNGPTITYLKQLAKRFNLVIISPILERDDNTDLLWNTAVVIDNYGEILGKHRKNHIPRVGDFNESTYYMEGNTGHPVFQTEFGRLAINICYGRHHPLNWLMFALNGAEIVFNPSATVGDLSEPLWGLETRTAAVANCYYTCAINRVGIEVFPNEFTSGDGQVAHAQFGHFYGSSYVTAPNGTRSQGLSRIRNGLLIAEFDLNLCRQVRDHWGFQMTQRLDLYTKSLTEASKIDYKQQIVNDRK